MTTAKEIWDYKIGSTTALTMLKAALAFSSTAAKRGADWTKHGGTGPYSFAPGKVNAVDPERKGGIRPAITGPAVVSVSVKLINLPDVGQRPTVVHLWARRYTSAAEPANATAPASFAIPQDNTVDVFRLNYTYQTAVVKAGVPVTFHLEHNGKTTLTSDLAQIIVTVHPVSGQPG